MVDVSGAVAEAGGTVQHLPPELVASLAQVLPSLDAVRAVSAGWHERKHHMVAWLGVGNARPDLFDDSRALMAQHHWQGMLTVALHVMQVAVTDTAGGQLDQNFMFVGSV